MAYKGKTRHVGNVTRTCSLARFSSSTCRCKISALSSASSACCCKTLIFLFTASMLLDPAIVLRYVRSSVVERIGPVKRKKSKAPKHQRPANKSNESGSSARIRSHVTRHARPFDWSNLDIIFLNANCSV